MREVLVTGVGVIAPGVSGSNDLTESSMTAAPIEPFRSVRIGRVDCRFTRPEFAPTDPHAPAGREVRAMRRDVQLGLLCVGRLVWPMREETAALRDTSLFVATGLCQDDEMERQVEEICQAYITDYARRTEAERNLAFFRMLPPLIALAGLSNACASFIARDHGIRGANAVFGVTSHSGHAALREGFHSVAFGQAELAVVGGANAAGTLSALTLSPLAQGRGRLREAEAAAFLLLESRASSEAAGRAPLCRVTAVTARPGVPDPRARTLPDWAFLSQGPRPRAMDAVLAGGSVFEEDACEMHETLTATWADVRSWYAFMGSAGAASVPLDVGTGAQMIARHRARGVLCANRDVFGRTSTVALEKAS